jgi:hypothetical protein
MTISHTVYCLTAISSIGHLILCPVMPPIRKPASFPASTLQNLVSFPFKPSSPYFQASLNHHPSQPHLLLIQPHLCKTSLAFSASFCPSQPLFSQSNLTYVKASLAFSASFCPRQPHLLPIQPQLCKNQPLLLSLFLSKPASSSPNPTSLM